MINGKMLHVSASPHARSRQTTQNIMMDVMFNIPSDPSIEKVVITKDCVDGKAQPEVITSDKKAKKSK